MTTEDEELLRDFVIESQEHLASVETQLLELESQQDNLDVKKVNNVFRAIHSIKGVAGFLNLKTLESIAHREEEVLNLLRNGEVRATHQVVNTLLKASDCIKGLLDTIESSNDQDVSEHILALDQLLLNPDNLVKPQAAEPPAPTINPGVLRDFLIESHDNLEQLETHLVSLEQRPGDEELLNSVFRTIHTIKGTAGFLCFRKIESLSHAAENLLSELRSGICKLDTKTSSALFSTIDYLRKQLTCIEQTHAEGNVDATEIIVRLNTLQKGETPSQLASNAPAAVVPVATAIKPTTSKASPHANPPAAGMVDAHPASSASDSTIRVDVALLDKLMTRVGELVLARNQIMQFSNSLGESELQSISQHLNQITTELQEGVMKTRMQPIGNVWGKFPRLVRDLAEICGKSVRIEMQGKETELDKTIIEAIKDPLTHLVRNTVDHGIEKPEIRVANGKPSEGCLYLRAYHEGGQVNIEISDDGAGLNLERIRSKALEKGLITAEQFAKLTERESAQLIFLPGFSTAEKVSNVSGRGVGMDVVKTNIEKIGGTVDLHSTAGFGTSIKIKIPLTLAIIPALVITNDGNRFAIPQVNLSELVRLEVSDGTPGIEWIQGSPVYRLRGRLLPLVYLNKILKTHAPNPEPNLVLNIVVLSVDGRQFGLVVDRINDTEEIVVKPMGKQLKGVPVFAGATIMGDGKVALILDVLGIAQIGNVISKDSGRTLPDTNSRGREETHASQTLLVLGAGTDRRIALPTSQVARLEKILETCIEFTDNREVVQYRGNILPLVRLADVLGIAEKSSLTDGLLNVVVYDDGHSSVGLVVNRIIDIVETAFDVSTEGKRDGLLGSAIIHEHVTDLLDLPAIIHRLANVDHYALSTH